MVEPFSPGHNVVVGRNGSGKSNFFAAIRFVLNDAYTRLGQEERQALLHEGSGQPSISAFVEIVFDNADGRFPTGRDEVVLRRTIGLKKDEYSLDRKTVTKADVMNLLQAAGFSRSNPYYIVPQGRITALTNAQDSERLELLKEVAGTRVYEDHRQESLKILEETAGKQAKITQLLSYIDERLVELAEEKEDLLKFQALDRQKRACEFILFSREAREASEALERLEQEEQQQQQLNHEGKEGSSSKNYMNDSAELERQLDAIAQLEREMANQRQQLQEAERDAELARADLEELQGQKAKLAVVAADHSASAPQKDSERQNLERSLQRIEDEICRKEEELAQVRPQVSELQARIDGLQGTLAGDELEKSALITQHGRFTQFATPGQRDTWIQTQLESLNETLMLQSQQLAESTAELEQARREHDTVSQEIATLEESLKKSSTRRAELDAAVGEARKARDVATDTRKELWRAEGKLQSALTAINEQVSQAERALAAAVDRATWQGIESVRRICSQQPRLKASVLYELLRVPDSLFRPAVEAVAGNTLFNVVVSDDSVATELLEALQREKAGRVTLIPLNRITQKSSGDDDDEEEDGDYNEDWRLPKDCIRLVEKLEFDEEYRALMESIFGRAVLVPSLEDSGLLKQVRSAGFTALTLEGDRVDRRGALFGGSLDTRKSRLELSARLATWKHKAREHAALLDDLNSRLMAADQHVTRTVSTLVALEQERTLSAPERILHNLSQKRNDQATLKSLLERRASRIDALNQEMSALRSEQASLTGELGRPLQRPTQQDKQRLSELNDRISATRTEIDGLRGTKIQLDDRMVQLEALLGENLRKRRLDLLTRLATIAGVVDDYRFDAHQLDHVTTALAEAQTRLSTATSTQDHCRSALTSLEAAVEKARSTWEALQRRSSESGSHWEKIMSRRGLLIQRREECSKRIRELGVIAGDPEMETVEAGLRELGTPALLACLADCGAAMKAAFGSSTRPPPNKKAAEMHAAFTRQAAALQARHSELDSSATSINQFIALLDQRKDDAILRTFAQVKDNFERVFERLCPLGKAQLILIRNEVVSVDNSENNNSDNSDNNNSEHSENVSVTNGNNNKKKKTTKNTTPPPNNNNNITNINTTANTTNITNTANTSISLSGIGIKASFASKSVDEGLLISQLSGGQKSLLALALIFAIQLVDPAPFYLFDEIDANLDAAARSAVADLIHSLADPNSAGVLGGDNARAAPPAQFITTTFRPELLRHANSFFGVSFAARVSRCDQITPEQALQFIEHNANE